MKRLLCCVPILFLGYNLFSQNLVPNWSFEQYSQCPNGFNQIQYATGWHQSHVDNCCGYYVEYMNACGAPGFQVPTNVWGYQPASTGVAYMAQVSMDKYIATNYRENIYAKLLSPLIIGETYYITMKVCKTNVSQYSSNNDGIKFATDTTMPVNNITAIHSANIITDTVNWTTISGCFKADSAYKYIGVGNFFDDAHTNSVQSCVSCPYSHWGYFVDDISVIPMSISGNDTLCGGGHAIIRATGGTSYLWSNGATVDSIIVNPVSTTTYSVQITNPSCSIDTSCTVYVISDSLATIHSSKPVICSGSSDTLSASGGATYHWSNGATTSSVIVNPVSTTTYSVLIAGGCGNKDTSITITVNPTPTLVVNSPANTICSGQSVALNVSGANSYSWTPSNGLSCNNCPNPTATPTISTTYVVTGYGGNGCTSEESVSVIVATPSIIDSIPNQNICTGDQVTLVANVVSGFNGTYSWQPGGSTNGAITVSPKSTTTYTVEYTNACGTSSITVTVFVNSSPIPSFSADITSGCAPLCVQFRDLSSLSGGKITAWSWAFGNGDTVNERSPIYCYPDTGSYTPSLTVLSNDGCSATLKNINMIRIFSKPIANFTYSPQPVGILNPTVQFTDESTDAYGIVYRLWNFGDGENSYPENTALSPTHTYSDTGIYCPQLIVENNKGCMDTVTNCLFVEPLYTLYIPSAFSPNGDGVNDVFEAKGKYIKSFEMYIFDRWGMELFHSTDINQGWNGTVKGGNVISQEDSYVYKITATDWDGKQHSYTGEVTLLK